MTTFLDLENWFQYHPPGPGDHERYTAIRNAGKVFAKVVLDTTPHGSLEQGVALMRIREAVMLANAAIACAAPAGTRVTVNGKQLQTGVTHATLDWLNQVTGLHADKAMFRAKLENGAGWAGIIDEGNPIRIPDGMVFTVGETQDD